MLRYPAPLRKGDKIGVAAPSSGVTGVIVNKLDNAVRQLQELGYNIVETASVRRQHKLTSAPAEVRAEEFVSLYLDGSVRAVIPPWGGEFLMDMLPCLDFDRLREAEPRWILGFSDTSTLLFTLTLNLGIATAHGPNLLDFGSTPIHQSVLKTLDILSREGGEEFVQASLDSYQKEWLEVTGSSFPPYKLSEKVEWKIAGGRKEAECSGRLIGGNLDVICKLIGTPFDRVKDYTARNKEDGVIWYFESCEMNSTDIYRTLWQMKMNGWFENCRGFLYGRAEGYSDAADFTLTDALEYSLADLNIPVIYDIDLGHLPPQLTFINGAYAVVSVRGGKGELRQRLI